MGHDETPVGSGVLSLAGLSPVGRDGPGAAGTYSGIPELLLRRTETGGGGTAFKEQTPTPVVARRGQALVFCYGMLHQSWQNDDVVPRKAYIMTWVARGVSGFLEAK